MKKLFALLLVLFVMLLPVAALAAGDLPDEFAGLLTPDTGILYSMLIVAAVIAADTLFGILVGIRNKEFDFRILPQFLITGVLPYLGGLVVLALLANYITAFEGLFYTSAAFVIAKYVGDLIEKCKLLFGARQPGV